MRACEHRITLLCADHWCKVLGAVQTVAILDAGHQLPFAIRSVNIDLPELQGEAEEIAKEKCRIAASKAGPSPLVPMMLAEMKICHSYSPLLVRQD